MRGTVANGPPHTSIMTKSSPRPNTSVLAWCQPLRVQPTHAYASHALTTHTHTHSSNISTLSPVLFPNTRASSRASPATPASSRTSPSLSTPTAPVVCRWRTSPASRSARATLAARAESSIRTLARTSLPLPTWRSSVRHGGPRRRVVVRWVVLCVGLVVV